MKCISCGEKFPANRNSPGIGGFSSPGVFCVINIILAASLYVLIKKRWEFMLFL
jgi:hypothetical protein